MQGLGWNTLIVWDHKTELLQCLKNVGTADMISDKRYRIEIVDPAIALILRQKSPAERLEMIAAANRTARILAAAGVRFAHPLWDEAKVDAEVIRRVCGGSG